MTANVDEIARRVRATHPRVTVLGASMLDRWVHGEVHRVSREAPVPVVEVRDAQESPGGAANTAVNLAALGARVRLLSVVGDDDEGRRLRRMVQDAGIDAAGLVAGEAATVCKTRIVGNEQVLVRMDSATLPIPAATVQDRWLREITTLGPDDTLLVCDYIPEMLPLGFLERLARKRPACRVIVDAHELARWRPLHPDIVTPNAHELERLLGQPLDEADRPAVVVEAAGQVLAAAAAASAVVTLDRDGAVSIDRAGDGTHVTRAHPAPESQAAGAGDTFAAALAVARAVDADLPDAADFAQRAADVVVSRPGTGACALSELVPPGARGVVDVDTLRRRLRAEREQGRTVVFTNGCFDILHPGHAAYLEQARALGDVLVVAVNDDDSVRRLKGPERPINAVGDRARMLTALGCVDYVISFAEDSPAALLSLLRPQIYVKGGDYTPEMLDETPVVRAYGGQVRTVGYFPDHSTTALVERLSHRGQDAV